MIGTNASNTWDNGYPSGGNYWSDYTGNDSFSGPNQDLPGSDGIGDTPYNITGYTPNDQDRYPLTGRLVINHPTLYTPSDPSPADGASGVSITTNLNWTGGDPDHDYNNYDVYFGTTNPPTYVDTIYLTNQTRLGYHPGTLVKDTTYYWKIVAWDAFNETASGPVWTFNTKTKAPSQGPSTPAYQHFPPTAVPGGPYFGVINTPVSFDGSASQVHVNNGSIIKYEWKFFGDDTWHDLGPKPTHTYTELGTYYVSLRVTDNSYYTGTDTTTATITSVNHPPSTPVISGLTTGQTGNSYSYSMTSTDPDGNTIRYFVDWGDGTSGSSSPQTSGTAYTASHTWTTAGVYTISAYARDSYNASSGTAKYVVAISAVSVPGLGYLIDTNGDGIYDSFYSNATGQTTHHVLRQADGTYLIDVNGDGTWDYVFNPVTGTYTAYSSSSGTTGTGWSLWFGGLIVVVILILLLILFMRRRKKQKPLGYEYPAHEKGKQ